MGTMEGQLDVVEEEEEEEGESVTSNYWTSLRSMSFLVPFTKSFSHTYSWLLCIFSHPIFASGVAAATAVVVVEALVALVEGRRRGKPWRRWLTLIRMKKIQTWNRKGTPFVFQIVFIQYSKPAFIRPTISAHSPFTAITYLFLLQQQLLPERQFKK